MLESFLYRSYRTDQVQALHSGCFRGQARFTLVSIRFAGTGSVTQPSLSLLPFCRRRYSHSHLCHSKFWICLIFLSISASSSAMNALRLLARSRRATVLPFLLVNVAFGLSGSYSAAVMKWCGRGNAELRANVCCLGCCKQD